MIDKIHKESQNIIKTKIERLKQIIPECFSEGILDIEKLQQTLGRSLDSGDEKYTFSWAGRNDTFKNIQTTSKGTLIPNKNDSVNFDDTENVFIEGENLEVLKLLQKSYFEKIKMVYIDPPYNTGKDFIYKDNFSASIQSYLEQTGQIESGIKITTNSETSGRFHSNWISFIYARLFIARNLLRNDGIVFVSIDDNEIHNLKLILNDIFGEENFLGNVIWQHSVQPKGYLGKFSVHHNYLLCYKKSNMFSLKSLERTEEHNKNYSNPDDDPKGLWRSGDVRNSLYRKNLIFDLITPSNKTIQAPKNGWRWSKETITKKIKNKEIIFNKDETRIIHKIHLNDVKGRAPETIWFGKDVGTTREASEEIKKLFEDVTIFDTAKPTRFLKKILQISTENNSNNIVLDFFSGSCSLAHAVFEYNFEDNGDRKFICVQFPEKCNKTSDAFNQGFDTIAEIGKERIRRTINMIKKKSKQQKLTKNDIDLGFKAFKLTKSNFRIWENHEQKDEDKLKEQMKLFESSLISEYKDEDVIYECIIKEGFDLNSKVKSIDISTNRIYKISDNEKIFYLTMDKSIKPETIDSLNLTKNDTLICIDAALDDSKKANLSKQCVLKTM